MGCLNDGSTLEEISRYVRKYLPKGWTLAFHMSSSYETVVILKNPEKDDVEPWGVEDASLVDMVRSRVQAARETEGLKPVKD